MNNKWKKIIVALLLFVITVFLGYNYIMHGGGRDIQAEQSAFKVTSAQIKSEFAENIDNATNKYLNKTIEISGLVSSIKDSLVTLDETIFCKMNAITNVTENNQITIKGRFVGYDDLLEELKLDECNVPSK